MEPSREAIERAVAAMTATLEDAGIYVGATVEGSTVTLVGEVDSAANRDAALDVAGMTLGRVGATVVDAIEIMDIEPDSLFEAGDALDLPDRAWERPASGLPRDRTQSRREIEPDFTGDLGTSDPQVAAAEGIPYFPPTDPVVRPNDSDEELDILNGFAATAPDDRGPDGSPALGDDDIADRVARELRDDATTTDLAIHIAVRDGLVVLTGEVATMDDAENAEAVAARVAGVLEVRESLRVRSLENR